MASSIHIAKGGSGYLAHNSREHKTQNAIFTDERNFCSMNTKEAFALYREELAIRSQAYSDRTGQRLQKNAITHLSAIVNLQQHHNEHDLKKIVEILEKRLDTKVFQFAIHRDEGHIGDYGDPVKNYHAHIEFLGLDSEGASVRKKLTRKELSTLQTEVAETLGMERGRKFAEEWAKYKSGELEKKPVKARRLDTYDFKQMKAQEQATRLATVKEVVQQYKQEREQLKQSGVATQSDYKELKAQYDTLKEHAKANELTHEKLTQAETKILNLRRALATVANKIEAEHSVPAVIAKVEELQQMQTNSIRLENAREEIKTLKIELESQNALKTEVSTLKAEKSSLSSFVSDLKLKIKGLVDQLQEYSQKIFRLESRNKELEKENESLKSQVSELKKDDAKTIEQIVKLEQVKSSTQSLSSLSSERSDSQSEYQKAFRNWSNNTNLLTKEQILKELNEYQSTKFKESYVLNNPKIHEELKQDPGAFKEHLDKQVAKENSAIKEHGQQTRQERKEFRSMLDKIKSQSRNQGWEQTR